MKNIYKIGLKLKKKINVTSFKLVLGLFKTMEICYQKKLWKYEFLYFFMDLKICFIFNYKVIDNYIEPYLLLYM